MVHLGCGDARRTAQLHGGDGYLVQGLKANAAQVEPAREYLHSLGLNGKVTVDTFDGKHLSYADQLVNLIVEDLGGVSKAELMRVLAPNGVAYLKSGGTWKKTAKPWPAELDHQPPQD